MIRTKHGMIRKFLTGRIGALQQASGRQKVGCCDNNPVGLWRGLDKRFYQKPDVLANGNRCHSQQTGGHGFFVTLIHCQPPDCVARRDWEYAIRDKGGKPSKTECRDTATTPTKRNSELTKLPPGPG